MDMNHIQAFSNIYRSTFGQLPTDEQIAAVQLVLQTQRQARNAALEINIESNC